MARTPVIFVPGLCGSFNLMVLLDWRGPTLSGWGFPPFISYGKQFLEAFEEAGYRRERDLFVAFYDWRKSVRDSARLYLKPWIERAKQRSGASSVILVGHSMGGLVARSYIQSNDYANDVARLITLGTPHRGAGEAYYTWGGGEPRSDPSVKAVLDVYLWYLQNAHPFQTQLNRLRTIRTQVPSIRDLLPIDNYLLNDLGADRPRPEPLHLERNLVGALLNQPAHLDLLVGRVPVTTIAGDGFPTIKAIVVGGPPIPPGDPPRYPDGEPLRDEVDPAGDGTVLTGSARLGHPAVNNLGPLPGASHGALPDHPTVLGRVFAELGAETPPLGAPPVEPTRLVLLTASPVTMSVETPAGAPIVPPGVLGAQAEAPATPLRRRRVRARDHGHRGKHLNIAVIANPPAGAYRVQLHGTATGTLALGAMIISATGVTVLAGAEGAAAMPATAPINTEISTVHGRVAAGTDLFYEVVVTDTLTAPDVHLDAQATAADAVAKLRAAVGGRVVLGGAEGDPVATVLGSATPEVRDPAAAALSGDEAATDQVVQALGGAEPAAMVDALSLVARDVLGVQDDVLAEALITQLQALT
ncbi:MAG: alpha/beta hydrolase [Chloroflexi bacterium]|nr:alpha/beta hydrolase [Chloroflexota bacterium]